MVITLIGYHIDWLSHWLVDLIKKVLETSELIYSV